MAQETYRIEIPVTVKDQTDPGASSARDNLNGFDKSVNQTKNRLDDMDASAVSNAASLAAMATATAAGIKVLKEFYEKLSACVDASIEFESVMTGVAKTTDLTDSELAAMGVEIKELSETIPVATSALGEVAEVAGQLGIQKDSLVDFTTTMSNLATATTMTADDAATMLAQFANVTQMDASEYENLASAIVDLGNNYATTEQKITELSQGIAAAGSLAGMSEADMVALSAAVTSLGIETQAGATSMSMLISNMMKAVETGDDLDTFASVANMSAQQFTAAWGQDAVGALEDFILGLNDTARNGASATVILDELGMSETRLQRMTLSLANAGDLLSSTLTTANEAWDENTALQIEAQKRYATTESQLTMMQNAYNNVKIAVGDAFTPVLKELYGISGEVLSQIAEFIEANPGLVRAITVFITILGVAVIGLAAYTAAVKAAELATKAMTAAIPGLNVIMAITTGIAALAGVIALLTTKTVETEDAMKGMSATTQLQYCQLQDLQYQYEETCETLGETSYAAQELQWRIEDLSAEYEASKRTMEDYLAAHEAVMQSYNDMVSAHDDAYTEIETERQSVESLIMKLEELASSTSAISANKDAIIEIIDKLNEQVPELDLSFGDVTGYGEGLSNYLLEIANAYAAQKKLEEQWTDYIDAVGSRDVLKSQYESVKDEAAAAEEVYNQKKRSYDLYVQGLIEDGNTLGLLNKSNSVQAEGMEEAKAYWEELAGAMDEAEQAYNDNEERIRDNEDAIKDWSGTAEESIVTTEDAIRSAKDAIDALVASYNEVYAAAYESISGQYALWDTADTVTAKSVTAMQEAMQSQIDFWNNYSGNLEGLMDRDIEGLDEMLAGMADGTAESAAALSGMAGASDAELAAMVEAYNKLQAAQKGTAEDIAAVETDFDDSMAEILDTLETTVEDMDMSDGAAGAALTTVQAYIDTISGMTDSAYNAAAAVAQSAVNGFYAYDFSGAWTPREATSRFDYSNQGMIDYFTTPTEQDADSYGYSNESLDNAFNGDRDSIDYSVLYAHAEGGIMTSPHMAYVAEDGPESIIPLTPERRSRGIELWEQTGELLGVRSYADGGVSDDAGDGYPITITAGKTGAGVVIEVSVKASPVFKIEAGDGVDESAILAVLKAHIREMTDDLGDELAVRLSRIFENMPVST